MRLRTPRARVLPVGPSLGDLVRAEARARDAERAARQLERAASEATSNLERRALESRAFDQRRRAVRERLRFLLGPGRETDAFATRLDRWLQDENIGPAALDALAAALAWKESPHGRS